MCLVLFLKLTCVKKSIKKRKKKEMAQKNQEFVLNKRHEGEGDLKNAWKLQDCPLPTISGK